MTIKEFKEKLYEQAKSVGFTTCELYYTRGNSVNASVRDNEVEEFTNSDTQGFSFRGMFKGKMGYASTQLVAEESIPFLIEEAKENALISEVDKKEIIYGGSPEEAYKEVKTYNKELVDIDINKQIELLKEIEKDIFAYDERVRSLNALSFSTGESILGIDNDEGLSLARRRNLASLYTVVIAEEDGETVTNLHGWQDNDVSTFNKKDFVRTAVENTVCRLGAKPVKTGKYPVVFNNETMASLLSVFVPSFYADHVMKGFSLLDDKIGERIASDIITIEDNPLADNLPSSGSFDSEGVATKNKKIVENGELKTYLHNLQTADSFGVESTGNGFKASYGSPVKVSATNISIANGTVTQNELFSIMEDGLYITELMGLHAGASVVSGDFSLLGTGFLIEDGKKKRPVNQITIAGNFFDLLKDVEVVANDLKYEFGSSCGSPSLLIKELSVAGS